MKQIIFVFFILIFLSASAQAADAPRGCAAYKKFRTGLHVDLQIPDPHYDFSKNLRQLNSAQTASHQEWLNRNGMQTVWQADRMQTLGQASGGWAMLYAPMARAEPYDSYGTTYCPYFDKLDISMMYRTIISVPKEFPQGSCGFNLIMQHEMLHHTTNVKVAQEVVARLKRDLPTLIAEIEGGRYVSRSHVGEQFKYMQESLKDAINIYIQETLSREMARRNALIDTPEEYKRVGKAIAECKGK